MIKIGLVHSGGQHHDGSMSLHTERNCARALGLYQQGRVDHLFIATAEEASGEKLGEQMLHFFTGQGVRLLDVDVLTAAHSATEALDKCREWAEHCFPGGFEISQIDVELALVLLKQRLHTLC